ncbi:MAG: thermonuclease family protein [Bacteroidetes bacterium]|nr:thermonuclease family protein [Bacteroidota bacterium]
MRRIATGIAFFSLFFIAGCSPQHRDTEFTTSPAYVIGSYTNFEVVDGDTFRIKTFSRGVRFLCIDTEEVPRGREAAKELARLRATWPAPYWKKLGKGRFPIKMPSPFGYETAEWAKTWFADVDSIRLERDSPDNVYGYFGRWLAYVFARKNGKWLNYNIECVRLGYSPYSMKYGFSERFHEQFLQAQDEARRAGRGIWNPAVQHYPQYEERLAWWTLRGDAIREYLALRKERRDLFFIGRDGEYERLALASRDTVCAFGVLGQLPDHGTIRECTMSHKKDVVVRLQFNETADVAFLQQFEQLYVYARGVVFLDGKNIVLRLPGPKAITQHPCP